LPSVGFSSTGATHDVVFGGTGLVAMSWVFEDFASVVIGNAESVGPTVTVGLSMEKESLEVVPSFVGGGLGVPGFTFVEVKTRVVDEGVGHQSGDLWALV
jgi:hypothetical protein